MTRIVQLANFYGPSTGGLKTVVEELARCYTDAGLERVLIAPGPEDAEQTDRSGRRIFIRAPVVPGSGGYRMVLAPRLLSTLLDRIGPDAVEVSDKLTLVAAARWARRCGVPSTLLSHERIDAILDRRVPRGFPLGPVADVWNDGLARAFDTVVCPSRFAFEEFDRIGATNARVVPWGVDLDTFCPWAEPNPPPRRAALEMVFLGRLSTEKDPGLAVDVTSELCRRGLDVHLTMVGTGPLLGRLERRARNVPVTFTGHLDGRREVARHLAAADVTVAPCRGENFGLAVLESLACGTPVVTSNSGGAPELCGRGTGMAVPADARSMADAVTGLLARDRATLRRRARAHAEHFPWARAAEAVLAAHLGTPEQARCA